MATEKQIATVAVILVALSFLTSVGYFGIGAATIEQYDFSIQEVKFPEKISRWDDFVAKATFVNTRPLSATFVTYDYRILDENNVEHFRVREGPTYVQLPTGVSTSNLESAYLPKAGKYKVKVTIDYLNQFQEIDENNNVYETTITVV